MIKSTTFNKLLQIALPEEEVKLLADALGYKDTARKFTVYDLLQFFAQAAIQQWDGYRDGADRSAECGLVPVNHSTISKKAKQVPFRLFKQLFTLMVSKCNRHTKRRLRIPKELQLIDSTKITAGLGRLPWAPLKGVKSGIKLHVSLVADTGQPLKVVETTGNCPDLLSCDDLVDNRFILVADRAYVKHKRFDRYLEERQHFVIRLRDNTYFHQPCHSKRKRPFASPVEQDFTCQLGKGTKRSAYRHRVIKLKDPHGHPVILATSLTRLSAEHIADIYKKRWQIEVFFRWVKQHLNLSTLFGTTPNSVFGQLYTALLVYVLLKSLFDQVHPHVPTPFGLSFAAFARLLSLDKLPVEWTVMISCISNNNPLPNSG